MYPIHQRVEAIRKKKGVTMTHIATHCQHSVSWYSDIAKGRRQMKVSDLEKISEALDENAGIFFGAKLSETLIL